MSAKLSLISIIFCIILFLILFYLLKKGKISIKYSMIWFISIIIILLFVITPKLFTILKNILGVQVSSNLLFAILISILMLISLLLTTIVSKQNIKITLLVQEISLLKQKVERNEK